MRIGLAGNVDDRDWNSALDTPDPVHAKTRFVALRLCGRILAKAAPMSAIINDRIEGTRITVWDVYQYTIVGWSDEQILGVLPITLEQLQTAQRYIDENRDSVHKGHLRIEERNARGNSPEIEEKLKQSRAKMQAWFAQKRAANRSNAEGTTVTALNRVSASPEDIAAFCRSWKIRRLSLFGSILRDDFRDNSDIDVLISLREDAELSLWDWSELRDELRTLLNRDVDLIEESGLRNPFRRHEIMRTRQVIYAESAN